jgi:hypothetical protein
MLDWRNDRTAAADAAAAAVLLAFGVPAGVIKDRLELTTTRVVAGQPVPATLVIDNPGRSINLTQVARPLRYVAPTPATVPSCTPGVGIGLGNGHYHQQIAFGAGCSGGAFIIARGITRISLTITTTYTSCAQPGGTITPTSPACSPSSGLVYLPAGRYTTSLHWSEIVPLPKPRAVIVEVIAPTPG